VEDKTFNLIYNVNVEETEAYIRQYEQAHRDSIAQNKRIRRLTSEMEKQRHAEEIKQAQKLREVALQENQEERRELENARMNIINRLATEKGNASLIAREGEKMLKGVTSRRGPITTKTVIIDTNGTDMVAVRGLKQIMKAEPEKPYDPFGGMPDIKDFVVLPTQPNLWNDYLGKLREPANDYTAGGYSLNEFYARSLSDAFSGLDILISQEKARDDRKTSAKVGGTTGASIAADADTKMTDVFT
jgi:CDK-activating kinase assembly factor MAT1